MELNNNRKRKTTSSSLAKNALTVDLLLEDTASSAVSNLQHNQLIPMLPAVMGLKKRKGKK